MYNLVTHPTHEMSAIELVSSEATKPLLDHAAVEVARLVRASRDKLLTEAGAVTLPMLAEGRRSTLNAARQWVHRHRKAGRLITVEHDSEVLLPSFQLDEAFDLHSTAAEATERLTGAGMAPWAVWRWFYAHNGWIDERPVDAARRGDQETLHRGVGHLIEAP
jgi:hypothetical protein